MRLFEDCRPDSPARFCPLMSIFEIRVSRFSSNKVLDKGLSEASAADEGLGSGEDFASKLEDPI